MDGARRGIAGSARGTLVAQIAAAAFFRPVGTARCLSAGRAAAICAGSAFSPAPGGTALSLRRLRHLVGQQSLHDNEAGAMAGGFEQALGRPVPR